MPHMEKLAEALIRRRGPMTLQQAADQSGIPLSTYFRLENERNENPPDMTNFVRAMEWIGVPKKEWSSYMIEEETA